MSESDGVDIPTRDADDKPDWREYDDVDWVELWESFGGDTPGPDYRREWLPERVDVWGGSPTQAALALHVYEETPNWGYEKCKTLVQRAIDDGSLYEADQGVICPADIVTDD